MTITVLIVDDHEVVRDGLHRLVAEDPGLEVVGEAASVAEARTLLECRQPDVVVLDIVLPDGDGIQLCRETDSLSPDSHCLLLTTFPERRAKLSAAIAGAAGYLPKGTPSEDIRRAIHAAATGARLMDQAEMQAVLDELATDATGHGGLAQLTPQERRAFELVGQGMSNREIGEQMHLSERTVKNYVSRMLTKLDMSRRTEAAVLAARISERHAHQNARNES